MFTTLRAHVDDEVLTVGPTPLEAASGPSSPTSTQALLPGQFFSGRYRIIRLLGSGGMGAVYQAWDDHLGIAVAVKIIRPGLSADPAAVRESAQQLKRELLLARRVTHKRVVRIHDFGEVDGVQFLTMPFVGGADLAGLLRVDGRLSMERALALWRQIVEGLAAAHEAGVVHRDLKPANVMVDADDQVLIMDFGIARPLESGSWSGRLIGTPAYMAPEQLHARPADERSDVYAVGLIFYEMLAGAAAAGTGDVSLGEIVKRRGKRPPALRSIGLPVPDAVDAMVAKCLDPDPARRFQSARELDAELGRLDAHGHTLLGTAPAALPAAAPTTGRRRAVALGLTVAVLAGAALTLMWQRRPATTASGAPTPVTVLVAEFQNRSGDPGFDDIVEQALGIALESASFITAYPKRDALRVANDVRPGAAIDEGVGRLVAIREGIQIVLSGETVRSGDGYAFSAQAVDAASGKPLVTARSEAATKEHVLEAVGRLASALRAGLGDATPESRRTAEAETFTAGSLDAARAYASAQEALWAGRNDQAIGDYRRALELDPELGRAYAGLAAVLANLGQREEADRQFQLALARIDRMTERERFRTRCLYYVVKQDGPKAIEECSALVKSYPSDTAGAANLALGYFYARDMTRALDEGRRAAGAYPRNVIRRNNVALYAMYAGDFAAAEKEAAAALQLNPAYAKAFIATALSQLAGGRPSQADETYRKLAAASPAGASLAASGLADLALFDGRLEDAVKLLEEGIARDTDARNEPAAAIKLATLGSVHAISGRRSQAVRALDEALKRSDELPVIMLAGRTFVELGLAPRAAALASQLERRVEPDPRAYGLLLRGEIALAQGSARAALDLFSESKQRADTWLGRLDTARADLKLGRFAEASSELDQCRQRRGEATALFLDEIPTYRLFPQVHYFMGQVQEGLKSPAASASYRAFLDIKAKADPADLFVRDARARRTP